MTYNFTNLDQNIRNIMVKEIKAAIESEQFYHSKRLRGDASKEKLELLLLEASKLHNEEWLALQIKDDLMFKDVEVGRNGRSKRTPSNAEEVWAGGQFNRYYIIAVCSEAISQGLENVEIYRAKEVLEQRWESQQLIGTKRSAAHLIEELRLIESSVNSKIFQANSGLSVRLS